MTTALDLIKGALRKIKQYAPGEALDADDATDALGQLNGMMDQWSAQHLAVFNNVEAVLALVPGKSAYSVGTGGDWNIARPLRLSSAYTRITTSSSVDFDCQEVSFDRYSQIGLKNQPGPWPKMMYFNTGFPLAEIRLWPVPQAGYEFHLWYDMLISQFASLTTALSMPQGYQLAIETNLACLLGLEYGGVTPELQKAARDSLKIIKSLNATPSSTMSIDPAVCGSGHADAGWILSGGF
jgi:hypothetical protein